MDYPAILSVKLSPRRLAILSGATFVAVLIVPLSTLNSRSQASPLRQESGSTEPQSTDSETRVKLIREGSNIKKARVTCRVSGDSLEIEFLDHRRRMTALENLASQRMLKAMVEDALDTSWIVSGTVTEFKGRNYLLIDRAQRSAAPNSSSAGTH